MMACSANIFVLESQLREFNMLWLRVNLNFLLDSTPLGYISYSTCQPGLLLFSLSCVDMS